MVATYRNSRATRQNGPKIEEMLRKMPVGRSARGGANLGPRTSWPRDIAVRRDGPRGLTLGSFARPAAGDSPPETDPHIQGVRLTEFAPTHRSMHTPIQTEAVLPTEHLAVDPQEMSGRPPRPHESRIRSLPVKSILSTAGVEPTRRSTVPAWSPLHD